MTIGKPIKCYIFNRNKGGYIYLPYEKTEYDIIYQGDKEGLREIRKYWISIGKPMYDNKKSFQENMQTIYDRFGFWPEPYFNEDLIQTALLDYSEYDADYFEFEKKLNMFPPPDKNDKKKVHFDEDEFDDDLDSLPF